MQTGRQTLSTIDESIHHLRQDFEKINQQRLALNEELAANQRQLTTAYQQLAILRLEEIEQGSLITDIDAANQRVTSLLQQRQLALNTLDENISSHYSRLNNLETNRIEALDLAEKQAQQVSETEALLQQQLSENNEYLAQFDVAKHADVIADNAEEKQTTAENDLHEKGKPYRDYPLFMYLWNRHYGTNEYQQNNIIAWLDSWVARLSNYDDVRVNYWNLQEIPKRLAAHATETRRIADNEREILSALESDIAKRADLPSQQAALAKYQLDINNIDDQITTCEQDIETINQQRSVILDGSDTYSRQCVDILSSAMAKKDMHHLHRLANRTDTLQDDILVDEIEDLKYQATSLQSQIRLQKDAYYTQSTRLKELQDIRRKFKSNQYDDWRSEFNNKELIASLLIQFIHGVISGLSLWTTIQQNQRHRETGARPDFGSGHIGRRARRQRNSSWHRPGRSGGGFRMPRQGGFKTGGGIKSGGFKTGGGF